MKNLFTSAALVVAICATSLAHAKTINMYSEPKADSKLAGTLNTEMGVTIVYTPKNSEWIKVANPANGDVGWVKSNELGGRGYSMRFITSGSGPNSYNIYQFGAGAGQYGQQQIDSEMKQFEQQQRIMHQHMQSVFNDMFNMFYSQQPIFVPVVMTTEERRHQKDVTPNSVTTIKKEQVAQTKQTPNTTNSP